MPPSFGKKKIVKIKSVGTIRKSKITQTYGVGALVEFPGFSGIMGGLNLWDPTIPDNMKIHEKVLEDLMGKKFFVQMSTDNDESTYSKTYKIPVIRFPEYYYCPQCHVLDKAKIIAKNYNSESSHTEPLRCNSCGCKELLPSRFVMVCDAGHIQDFPYVWWTHKSKGKCENPRLTLKYVGKTGGLESIHLTCENCGATNTMANCLSLEATKGIICEGHRPWFGKNDKCECNLSMRALMRGANNIYYPEIISTLTIPPWSNEVQQLINREYKTIKEFYMLDNGGDISCQALKKCFVNKGWNKILNCSENEFINQIRERFENGHLVSSVNDMKINEYKALSGNDKDDPYFKTETVQVSRRLKPFINQIKKVRRLRQIKVLTGFRRISAFSEDGGYAAPISREFTEWLPANELLGEGIFVEFNKEHLVKWGECNKNRYLVMRKRYDSKNLGPRYGHFTPEFVAIHTFSHLLIRELSMSCGYDSSSLAELIYIDDLVDGGEMCGVLIYTSTSSSDGSLGGLVREASTESLEKIIEKMLERASWCSNDPICIESKEQGSMSLNYAACHACSLLSETSCGYNNMILDRCALIGTDDEIDGQGLFDGFGE